MAAEEEESCSWYQVGCHASEWVSDTTGDAISRFVEGLHDDATTMLRLIGTWWLELGGPDFGSEAVTGLQDNLRYFVWVFGIIGFLFALGKLAITQDVRSGAMSIGAQIFRMIVAGSVYIVALPLLVDAGDATAVWLLDQAMDEEIDGDFSALAGSSAALGANIGTSFLIFLFMLLGAIVNFIFMIFRDIMFLVLISFIVVLAAASGTESGSEAWRRANGWFLALLLFKPVAGGIYALGFRPIRQQDMDAATAGDSFMNGLVSSLTGLAVLIMAALALPAPIRFISPAAAAGAGAFSGGAALGATAGVAAGAAVIAGTGGAGAAGMAGAGGGGGMTAAGAGGAGASGAGGSAAAGASSTPSAGGGSSAASGSTASGGTGTSNAADGASSPDSSGGASGKDAAAPGSGATESISTQPVGASESTSSPAAGAPASAQGSGTETPAASGSSGNGTEGLDALHAYQVADGAVPKQDGEEHNS